MSFVCYECLKDVFCTFECLKDVFFMSRRRLFAWHLVFLFFFYLFQNVMIVVLGNQNMHFGRTEGLCALASFVVTEDLNNEQKSKISTSVFKALLAKGVPSSRLVHS